MRVYRALNDYDENNLKIRNQIVAGLITKALNRHNYKAADLKFSEKDIKNISELVKRYSISYYDISYVLENIISHISGSSLKDNNSAFISTTKSFRYGAEEYSIPQSGKYNYMKNRKSIAIIDLDESKKDFVDNVGKLKEQLEFFGIEDRELLKERVNKNIDQYLHYIDLSDNKLEEYRMEGNLPVKNDRNPVKKKKLYFEGEKSSVKGFSNFASKSSEVLAFKYIPEEKIKEILLPDEIDLAYFGNLDLNNDDVIKMLKDKNTKKALYDFIKNRDVYRLIGRNVIDVLTNSYKLKSIKGDLTQHYESLCKLKAELLRKFMTDNLSYINFSKKQEVLDKAYDVAFLEPGKYFENKRREKDLVAVEYKNDKDRKVYVHTYNRNTHTEEWQNVLDKKDTLDKKLIYKPRK